MTNLILLASCLVTNVSAETRVVQKTNRMYIIASGSSVTPYDEYISHEFRRIQITNITRLSTIGYLSGTNKIVIGVLRKEGE